MKKKGLIISTIVMVVVLIAALTTSTYAWFNSAAAAAVDNVKVSVESTSNISVGIATSKNVARQSATNYVNGAIEYTETATTADQSKGLGTFASSESKTGLGLKVNWDWSLSSNGGVSSSANGTAFDSPYSLTNALYNGTTSDGINATVVDKATYNKATAESTVCTVIYAPFGVRVEKEDMNYLYCDITVTADSNVFWGIVTSLKLEIYDGTTTHQYHPFASTSDDGLLETALTYQSSSATQTKVFRFVIAYNAEHITYNGEAAKTATIYQFDLRMFLDGEDGNCIADATQYGANIGIAFNACATADYDASGCAAVEAMSGVTLP